MEDDTLERYSRILFVAEEACGNLALSAAVRARAADAAEVLVVAPVLGPGSHSWVSDDTEDRALARERLDASIDCLRKHGLRARGTLGDADPLLAIEDALYRFPAEEIVICLEEPERSGWQHRGVVERAGKRFDLPVTEIVVAPRQLAAVAQD